MPGENDKRSFRRKHFGVAAIFATHKSLISPIENIAAMHVERFFATQQTILRCYANAWSHFCR